MSTEDVLALFELNGLRPAPGYLSGEFWRADKQGEILERAGKLARFARAAGCTELYVAAAGSDDYKTRRGFTRRQVSGHVHADDAMRADELQQFAHTLNLVGEITLREGVYSCFHNHVGTLIETRAEIDSLFALLDPNVLFMGPDTGHLAWAGVDVVRFCQDYARQIKTMHIKDIDPTVREQGQAAGWDYRTFSDRGIFTEVGSGCVDFPAVLEILNGVNFGGWLIVETDVTQQASPLISAQMSRDYLRSLGL
jgi:inosose dehydratase